MDKKLKFQDKLKEEINKRKSGSNTFGGFMLSILVSLVWVFLTAIILQFLINYTLSGFDITLTYLQTVAIVTALKLL